MSDVIAPDRALADTNVVVYAYDPADPVKHLRARELLRNLSDAERLVFSTQVLNEFCSVVMRPNRPAPLSPSEARVILTELAATGEVLSLSAATTLRALEAMPLYSLSFWDALIWATARENGVPIIFTEDFQDGREVEGVVYRNPFAGGAA